MPMVIRVPVHQRLPYSQISQALWILQSVKVIYGMELLIQAAELIHLLQSIHWDAIL